MSLDDLATSQAKWAISAFRKDESNNPSKVKSKKDYNFKKNPFRPLLISLQICGMPLNGILEVVPVWRRIFNGCWTIIFLILLHHYAFCFILIFMRGMGTWSDFNNAVVLWTGIATADVFMYQRRKFLKLICTLDIGEIKLSDEDKRILKKTSTVCCCIGWTYVLTWTIQYLVFKPTRLPEKYFKRFFYGMFEDYFSPPVSSMIIRVDQAIRCFFVQSCFTLVLITYLLLCRAMRKLFQNLKKHVELLKSERENISVFKVRHIRVLYNALAKKVEIMDTIFCVPVMFWFLMVVIALCVRVITIMEENISFESNIQNLVIIMIGLSRTMVILFGTSFSADLVSQDAKAVLLTSEELLSTSVGYISNCIIYQEIIILLNRIITHPVELTVGSFAQLSRVFLMNCVGVMTTYVFISLQMNPKAMKDMLLSLKEMALEDLMKNNTG